MVNRLAGSASPYLLQHADNPVDWWPWCDEAFEKARERDVPVLLSVGYAACHWCHVMAHESFEDPEIAAVMNEHFVNIKVDREERPDVDAVYMSATQAMTGQGGWPMTCFLTPEGEPFHCGTYFPARPLGGMPAFRAVLDAVSQTWRERREEVRSAAGNIVQALRDSAPELPPAAVDAETTSAAVRALEADADAQHGGFGDAPKFPPSMVLEFLLRHHERTGSETALSLVCHTASAMACGGIFDQLAGGFARYSTDRRWIVPHFEKMLSDNALLLRAYAHLYRRTGSELARRVTEATAGFLLGELRTPEGGFAASLDADTGGVEGLTYVWTPAQLAEVLGEADGAWAAELLGVTEEGTFEHGSSTLRMAGDPFGNPDDAERWRAVRERLLAARAERAQPGKDDKVVAEWNGLAITALVEASRALGRPEWLAAARECAEFLLAEHLVEGRLRRTSRGGRVGAAGGVLADYGALAEGLLALFQADADARFAEQATQLLGVALAHFAGPDGAFYDTADDAEELLRRPSEPMDNATPAGASVLAAALLTGSALLGGSRYQEAAESALARAAVLVERAPRFAGEWLAVAEAALSGPVQVGIVGPDDEARTHLLATAIGAAAGGTVVQAGRPEQPDAPLLADRPLVAGRAAAYVCRGYVCDRPATTADELTAALAGSGTTP
jgi:uncharacterized protein YyaL (SSP411 family)